jgi:prepilin signal peptidase PulO-like enzyme (type II secretory pathway)
MLQIIFTVLLGYAMGIISLMLTRLLIKNRTGRNAEALLLRGACSFQIWGVTSAVAYALILRVEGFKLYSVQFFLIFSICLCISAVDVYIRKIPNELLLSVFIVKIAFTAAFYKPNDALVSIIGFVMGLIVFSLPSYLGMSIGWGDIKFASAAGFYLGILGLLQVVIIMGLCLGIYAVYLYATKKGNLRTASAMGPYISLGIMATMLFPIINLI